MTTKIIIFSKYGSPSFYKSGLENLYSLNNDSEYGPAGLYYITANDDYTHAVILDCEMPHINLPKERVIGFSTVSTNRQSFSKEFAIYAATYISKYFVCEKGGIGDPFVDGPGFTLHQGFINYQPDKKKLMSMVVNNNRGTDGNRYSHLLVQRIIGYNLNIDIYGLDGNLYKDAYGNIDARIKSGVRHPSIPYSDYSFSIVLEDYSQPNYYTSRLIDPIIYGCTPINFGCSNASEHMNGSTVIHLTCDINHDMKIIQDVLKAPAKFYSKPNSIVETQNFVKKVRNIFQDLSEN